ncbi:MAG: class I SAM-dependent methyltransferase [Candidatus Geothermincolia bacterium]
MDMCGGHHHDDAERRQWQDPEAILARLGLAAGDVFMDIGCGGGFFSLPAARIVGPTGKVYALDVSAEPVAGLRERAASEGLANIETVVAPAEKTVLCEACADIIFFGIDLHDFGYPGLVLANALTMLKPGGRVVDLDWKVVETPFGPPMNIRFSEEKARGLLEEAGLRVESVEDLPPWFYLITARRA